MNAAAISDRPGMSAFTRWIRTGRLPDGAASPEWPVKFNPYHDPRNGRFTFAPGGSRSLNRELVSNRRASELSEPGIAETDSVSSAASQSRPGGLFNDGVFQPQPDPMLQQVNRSRPRDPRLGIGGNRSPFFDPVTLQEAFPGLNNPVAGVAIVAADNLFDFSGPASELTTALTVGYSNMLVEQIRALDPTFQFDSFGTPMTLAGQNRQIGELRLRRASAFLKGRKEARPLQVEIARFLQGATNVAYRDGQQLAAAGRLRVRLSEREAVGNYVDLRVRRELRELLGRLGVPFGRGEIVRVVGREYDSSGSDLTYRVPDARVGNVAFDITLSPKTSSSPQVRGFFSSDFRPEAVIIIRPSQLGSGSTYALGKPKK